MTHTQTLSLSEIIPARVHSDQRRQENLFSSPATKIKRTYECTWLDDIPAEHHLPNIIVPVDSDLESLFADVATYYPEYSPITAYTYSIDRRTLHSLGQISILGSSTISHQMAADDWRRRIQIALIFAETLSRLWTTGRDEDDISYSQCRGSLAFCLARCGTLYRNFDNALVASKWTELRELLGMEALGSLACISHAV